MVYFKDSPILFIDKWEDLYNIDMESKYINLQLKTNTKSKFSFYRDLIQQIL